MPALSWNEIRQRSIAFANAWQGVTEEHAEAQSFWNEFFQVFGLRRRTVAAFEARVKSIKNTHHRIDLFWKGKLLAEHKSAGQPLDKAESQAFTYIQELAASNREEEIPRYVILCDFVRMVLFDLEPEEGDPPRLEFLLQDLEKYIHHFAFFIGQKTHKFGEEDPANLEAAQIMADLHDTVAESGYDPKDLERLLVRILFCLFADDTGIFDPAQFELYLENRTHPDASDLGSQLNGLFGILDTPGDKRPKFLDEDLAAFPYINGELFKGALPLAGFNPAMRNALLAACNFDWSRISPAIFGSLFQGIMDAAERRQIGAHYTSERDILKLIRPLFLDALRAEFQDAIAITTKKTREVRLRALRHKLTTLKFLDPACGCGNFLVIAYRELRKLEHDILEALYDFTSGAELDLGEEGRASRVDVDQFYGIEIDLWPARIAETALWLTDHQMNTELSKATGNLYQRIPLKKSPHIRCANALRIDWNDLLPAKECSYVMGNPPFIGHHYQDSNQKVDQQTVLCNIRARGVLDYVCNWYVKAAEYTTDTETHCAFVSTNSISQGEQVGILWAELIGRHALKINFAHRTFSWQSEAKGKAHVHVVIIGFGHSIRTPKLIFDYPDGADDPQVTEAENISPYLIEGPDAVVIPRTHPLCGVPKMSWGNKPTDGGNLILSPEERDELILAEPAAEKFVHRYMSGGDFIKGIERYCLWLKDAPPNELHTLPRVMARVAAVRECRLKSKAASTRKYAEFPALFRQISQPNSDYLAIPEVSSERRRYIPMAYLSSEAICSNTVQFVPDATPCHFGVLTSVMHMAWVRQVCGRLKSDYRYSNSLVYNNFPWPEPSDAQRAKVEACAQGVLDARQVHLDQGATLADLYDPLTMPAALLKAHHALDGAVDKAYRPKAFASERERVEFLFARYAELTAAE